MTENNKDRTVTIAIVTGVVTLLLGLCLGGVAGGLGGYFIGRGNAPRAAVEPMQPQVVPPERQTPPTPRTPQMPQIPDMLSRSGALIQEVVKDTPAAEAGLKVGDVITKVDNTPVDATHRLGDILAGYRPGAQVTLTVWRVGVTQTIKVKLGENPDGSKRAYLGVRYSEISAGQGAPNPGQ